VEMISIAGAAFIYAAVSTLSASSGPAQPFIEHTSTGIAVNGDIIVRNSSDDPYELIALQMDALDSQGEIVQRRELNMDGISPGILTIPDRALPKQSTLLIYNPFPEFGRQLPVARLRFALTFKKAGTEQLEQTRLDVSPIEAPRSGFELPVKDARLLVWDGHDFYSHHRRWNYLHPSLVKLGYLGNSGRYAYDFIALDSNGRRSNGDEKSNESWVSFGLPVRATSPAIVVAVRADAPDDRTYKWGSTKDPNAVFGNYVVLKHSDGTYSTFGHLMHASPTVGVGQHVAAGQILGRIGASGDSLFPHLHYQRTLQPGDFGEGVPVVWRHGHRVVGRGALPLPNGFIDTGDVVSASK